MELHIILGSSSVGKTSRSIELASNYNAPVIVLDKIQTFDELSTGSGRPQDEELNGTTRVYLDNRLLEEGELSISDAVITLNQELDYYDSINEALVILEGGSTSIAEYLFTTDYLTKYDYTVEHLKPDNLFNYRRKFLNRVLDALDESKCTTLIEELDCIWHLEDKKNTAIKILGYNVINDWCNNLELSPILMWNKVKNNDNFYMQFLDEIMTAYFKYATYQRTVFDGLVNTRGKS